MKWGALAVAVLGFVLGVAFARHSVMLLMDVVLFFAACGLAWWLTKRFKK